MRNAGDLGNAEGLLSQFQSVGAQLARGLSLPTFNKVMELPQGELEASYYEAFDELCAEVRSALSLA